MNRLKGALNDLATQGPPLRDLAERAIRSARRRRAGHRIALAAAVTLVAVVLLRVWPSPATIQEPTLGQRSIRTITFANEAPEPLPPGPAGPVLLAYTVTCDPPKTCGQWRVVMLNGQEFRVTDAIGAEVRNGMWEHDGVLSVAPDGTRIGYFDAKGRFTIRDMRTGTLHRPFSVPRPVLTMTAPHVAWSPDGRRLAVDFSPVDDDKPSGRRAVLVDLTTMATTSLPGSCCVLGLGAGDVPIPLYDAFATTMGKGVIRYLNDDGGWRGFLPLGATETASIYPLEPSRAAISADGSRFATLMWPQPVDAAGPGMTKDITPELTMIDSSRATMSGHHPLPQFQQPGMPAEIAGWRDPSTVLITGIDKRPGVYAVDTTTGESHQLISFPSSPARLSVAPTLL
jgi:hypothetical protein